MQDGVFPLMIRSSSQGATASVHALLRRYPNRAKAEIPRSSLSLMETHNEIQSCQAWPLGNIFTSTFHFQFRSRFLRRQQAALQSQVTRSAQI